MSNHSTEENTGTLAAALLAAQRNVRPVPKSGVNTAQGWRFIEAHEVVRVARDALHAAGLVAVLRHTTTERLDLPVLDVYLEVTHAASGEVAKYPMPWPIERHGPQARRAAATYAEKEALRHLLLIAEPDDPETHSTPTTTAAAAQPRPDTRPPPRRDPQPMTDPQRHRLWAVARTAGYGDVAELAAFTAGIIGVDLDAANPDELLRSLTTQEASSVIDALQHASVPAVDEPDPERTP